MTATARRLQAPTPRVALLAAAVVVLAALLYLARHVLAPFVIGIVLVYALDPLVDRLARLRLPGLGRPLPRGLAVLVVYLVVAIVLVEGLALLFRPLAQQLGEYLADLPRFAAVIDEQLRRLAEAYQGLALPETIRGTVDRFVAGLREGAGGFDPATLLPLARTIAGAVGAVLGLLIVPVWAFYILKDRDQLMVGFDRSLPPAWRADVWAVLNIIERTFGRWLRGQLLLGLVVGLATFGGLLLLGVLVDARFIRFAVLLAVVAGIFELLPIVGPILSMIPTLLVAATISPGAVAAVVVLYLVVQQLENNVLVPKIQGDAVELHPSIVILALVVGGAIAGLLGAIFALPVAAAGRDVYRYLYRRLGDAEEGAAPETAAADLGVAAAPPATLREEPPAASPPAPQAEPAATGTLAGSPPDPSADEA